MKKCVYYNEMVVGDGWIEYVVVGIEHEISSNMGVGEIGIEERISMIRIEYFF
jgi:hypothetical protein